MYICTLQEVAYFLNIHISAPGEESEKMKTAETGTENAASATWSQKSILIYMCVLSVLT